MKEITGDIFKQEDADAICFTSNGVVNKNGELVMGAGVAKAFKDKYPGAPSYFGGNVKVFGNHVHFLDDKELCPVAVVNFPTKHHFKEKSDIRLIQQSAKELEEIATLRKWKRIYLTRPGCGLGGLNWETQVKPLIAPILDDRFVVISK